jgi:hypothetical protein
MVLSYELSLIEEVILVGWSPFLLEELLVRILLEVEGWRDGDWVGHKVLVDQTLIPTFIRSRRTHALDQKLILELPT